MAMRRAAGSLLSAVKDTLRVQVEAPAMGSLRKYGATTATQQAHNAQGALAVLFNSFKNGTGLLSGGKRLYGDAALSKDEVTARVLEVVKNMDKVDPSKVNAESCDFTKDLGLNRTFFWEGKVCLVETTTCSLNKFYCKRTAL